jgi:hypothetical protein
MTSGTSALGYVSLSFEIVEVKEREKRRKYLL